MKNIQISNESPVVIGGVGGSGTRVVANIIQNFGYYIGSDLNEKKDNLFFYTLFVYESIINMQKNEFENLLLIFLKAMIGNGQYSYIEKKMIRGAIFKHFKITKITPSLVRWFVIRYINLIRDRNNTSNDTRWGWKEPNSHIVLEKLFYCIPKMKYIHVIRNGLDMAYSKNQNQLKLWGKHFINSKYLINPYNSLKYWCIINESVIEFGNNMQGNFFLLNFDYLCRNPINVLNDLIKFLEIEINQSKIIEISKYINEPKTKNRYLNFDISELDKKDIAYVETLGFTISSCLNDY